MKKNVGKVDKYIRFIIGIIIIIAAFVYGSWWGLVGAALVLTAILGWCPLYLPFKISTNKNNDN